ncbi:MAG: hypothetical protein WB775_15255 [Burkholderiaceae bacterium]
MKHSTAHFLSLASVALALSACGGGDEPATVATASAPATELAPATAPTPTPATAPAPAVLAAATCDKSLFSTSVALPTAAQLAPYAKTYAGATGSFDISGKFTKSGSATLVLNADGSTTYNGTAIDVKSLCYEEAGANKTVYIHWGTRGTAGAAAFYDNHVDLFADGTASGAIGADIFKAP